MAAAMKIGVVSDTHDFFDPQLARLLAGVDHILHAGDIGRPRILHQLEELAPVTAVGGNTDDSHFRYPLTELAELAGRRFLVHHIVNPHAIDLSLERRIARDKPEVIVFGHTHKRWCQTHNGILFFNPGYAGKPRFGMERSVAILHASGDDLRPEFLPLG